MFFSNKKLLEASILLVGTFAPWRRCSGQTCSSIFFSRQVTLSDPFSRTIHRTLTNFSLLFFPQYAALNSLLYIIQSRTWVSKIIWYHSTRMSQTILPATQLEFSQLLEGTLPSINHNISNDDYFNTSFDSDLQMNIEFTPSEQLDLHYGPDSRYVSPYYSSQYTKSSQETAIAFGSQDEASSILSPTPQITMRTDWQFHDPTILTQPVGVGSFKSNPAKKIMDETDFTPQLTPPRSPAEEDRLVGSNQPVAIDFLVMDDQDADQELENLELPNEISQYLDQDIPDPDQLMEGLPLLSPASSDSNDLPVDIFSDMESQSSGGHLSLALAECPEKAINVSIDHVFSGKIEAIEEPVAPVDSMECSNIKGDETAVVKPCKAGTIKSGRGRKRKAVGKDREERKREQNAIAAKRYRERQQEKMDQIFQEKMKLEESLAALRRKKQSRMDERNIMLFMVYELAKEKQTLDRFVFPSWLEPLYKKHKEGK